MTVTEVKDFLSRGYNIERYISSLRASKSSAYLNLTKTSLGICDDLVQSSGINVNELKLCSYVDYDSLLEKYINDLLVIKNDIFNFINKLEDNMLKSLLIYRYINYLKWEEIALIMNYSYRQIFRNHKKAIERLSILSL